MLMDYVAWCHKVLDAIVEMVTTSREFHYAGFRSVDVEKFLFGEDTIITSDYRDGDRPRALSQAIYALADQRSIGQPDPVGSFHDPVYVLTDQGRKGGEGLKEGWDFTHAKRIDKERWEVLAAVNAMSEERRTEFAFLRLAPHSEIKSRLGWDDLRFDYYFDRDRGGSVGSHYRAFVEVDLGDGTSSERFARTTYDGIVHQYYREDIAKSVERANARRRPKISVPKRNLDLSFMTDTALRGQLEQDYLEALICSTAEAYKAASILLVGILEGILLYAFQQPPLASDPQLIDALTKMNKKSPMSGNFN
jgi:hypothetical protein